MSVRAAKFISGKKKKDKKKKMLRVHFKKYSKNKINEVEKLNWTVAI